jgi:hypothetical protein
MDGAKKTGELGRLKAPPQRHFNMSRYTDYTIKVSCISHCHCSIAAAGIVDLLDMAGRRREKSIGWFNARDVVGN